MRRSVRIALGTMLVAIGAACGVDIVGERQDTSPTDPEGGDGGNGGNGDLSDAPSLPPADPTPPGETPIDLDSGLGPPDACAPTIVATNFAGGIQAPFKAFGTAAAAVSYGNGFVSLIPTDQGNKSGGLFYVPDVDATSFKIKFDYYVQKPYTGFEYNPSFGDGLALVWLTSGDVTKLGEVVTGSGLGIPKAMGGTAFALDTFTNTAIADPSPPSFSLLRLDATKVPGAYNWHIKNNGPYSGFYDAWRSATVTFQGGKLSVDVSGTKLFQDEPVSAAKIVAVGLTAGTGGTHGLGFFVDTVRIELTDAVCR